MRFYFCPYTHRARLVAAASYIIYIYKDRRRPPVERMRVSPPPPLLPSRFRSTLFDGGDSVFELPRNLNHHPKHHGRRRRPCDINRSPPPLTGHIDYRGHGFCFIPQLHNAAVLYACTELYVSIRRVRWRADVLGGTCQHTARRVLFTTVPAVLVATAQLHYCVIV